MLHQKMKLKIKTRRKPRSSWIVWPVHRQRALYIQHSNLYNKGTLPSSLVGEIPKNPNLFYSYKCPSIFKMTKCLYALHAYLTCLHFRFWKQLPACSEDALPIRCGCTNARWCAWWMWKKTMANNICLANDLQHEIVVLYATLSMAPPVGPTLHTYNI